MGTYSRSLFDPCHNLVKFSMRLQNHVNVIGHHYPGKQIVTAPDTFAIESVPASRHVTNTIESSGTQCGSLLRQNISL